MARPQSYVPWSLVRRVDLRRADAEATGKEEAGFCSVAGCVDGCSPAAAGAVEDKEEGYRGLVDGRKEVRASATAGGDGGSYAFNATAMVAPGGRRTKPIAVKPIAVLPATVKNVAGSFRPIPKIEGQPPAILWPTVRAAPPRKRTSASPYASMDLATRLVMAKRWARETKVFRRIVPETNAGFAAERRRCTEASSLTHGRKRGAPLELEWSFRWKQPRLELVDARRAVQERLREFRDLAGKFQLQNRRKPDMDAFMSLKASGRTPDTKYLGEVPGVEVGDEFYYRTELMVAGLHGSPIAGIDAISVGGQRVAACVVSQKFKGYVNLMKDSDVLVYSGQGGNPLFESTRKKEGPREQRLDRGNLALKNSMVAGTEVRVVHGFRVDDGELTAAETKSTVKYVYDGLYVVEKFWWEMGPRGFKVLKFQMRRVPGQRKLELKQVLRARAAGGNKQVLTAPAAGNTLLLPAAADLTTGSQTLDLPPVRSSLSSSSRSITIGKSSSNQTLS